MLDAALANQMVALATQADAKCKRHAEACAQTQAAIAEIQSKIAELDAAQIDLVKEAEKSAAGEANAAHAGGNARRKN